MNEENVNLIHLKGKRPLLINELKLHSAAKEEDESKFNNKSQIKW